MFSFFNESVKTHTNRLTLGGKVKNYLFSQKAQVRGRLAFKIEKKIKLLFLLAAARPS